ncbi:hypothetical protein EG68_09028, partial [Paragonimus skrjabini miyazakii]
AQSLSNNTVAVRVEGQVFFKGQPAKWNADFLNNKGEIQKNLIWDLCRSVNYGIAMVQNLSMVPNYCNLIELYNGSLYAIVDIYMNRTVLDFFGVDYTSVHFHDLLGGYVKKVDPLSSEYIFQENVVTNWVSRAEHVLVHFGLFLVTRGLCVKTNLTNVSTKQRCVFILSNPSVDR